MSEKTQPEWFAKLAEFMREGGTGYLCDVCLLGDYAEYSPTELAELGEDGADPPEGCCFNTDTLELECDCSEDYLYSDDWKAEIAEKLASWSLHPKIFLDWLATLGIAEPKKAECWETYLRSYRAADWKINIVDFVAENDAGINKKCLSLICARVAPADVDKLLAHAVSRGVDIKSADFREVRDISVLRCLDKKCDLTGGFIYQFKMLVQACSDCGTRGNIGIVRWYIYHGRAGSGYVINSQVAEALKKVRIYRLTYSDEERKSKKVFFHYPNKVAEFYEFLRELIRDKKITATDAELAVDHGATYNCRDYLGNVIVGLRKLAISD